MKIKKLIALGLAVTCVLTALTGCGAKDEPTDSEQANEQAGEAQNDGQADSGEAQNDEQAGSDRTQLIVGFDASHPPYGYMDDNGEYVGFDLDLAAEVCARKGWELVKKPIDWDAKDFELESGSIDCIWNGFTINGREDDYTWTKPYVDNSQVVITKADSGISSLADLAGKIVLVQADSAALSALESEDNATLKESFGELTQVADYNSALMTLESGGADAVALDKVVADYYVKDKSDTFNILDEELSTEQYGIGFKKGNDALKDEVEAVLLEMLDDGKFEEIATKWDQQDVICLGK